MMAATVLADADSFLDQMIIRRGTDILKSWGILSPPADGADAASAAESSPVSSSYAPLEAYTSPFLGDSVTHHDYIFSTPGVCPPPPPLPRAQEQEQEQVQPPEAGERGVGVSVAAEKSAEEEDKGAEYKSGEEEKSDDGASGGNACEKNGHGHGHRQYVNISNEYEHDEDHDYVVVRGQPPVVVL